MQANTQVCQFFLKGNCRYGENCRRSHKASAVESAAHAVVNTISKTNSRNKVIVDKAMATAGKLLLTLHPRATQQGHGEEAQVTITNFEFLASYNWKGVSHPTIYVPGSPPKWTPPELPCQIPKDNGQARINDTAKLILAPTFDPLFKALLTMHPNFDMNPIDLVADRNSLRKLLKFTSNQANDSWRIDVDVVGETVFLSRWEPSKMQVVTGSFFSGYGHQFEKAFTGFDGDVEDSLSHHRIVRYDLGGLECLIRFEVDAYVEDEGVIAAEDADLSSSMNNLDLSLGSPNSPNDVEVILRGRNIPHSSTAEIKCTSSSLQNVDRNVAPQLWISQTPSLFIGRHKDGLVTDNVPREDTRDRLAKWEVENKHNLQNMVRIIKEIKEATEGHKDGRWQLVYEKSRKDRKLQLFERKGGDFVLPAGVKERCWNLQTS